MNNKVLVKLIMPEYDVSYDLFIPVNEVIWKLKRLILKSVQDLSGANINNNIEYLFINKDNSRIYNTNEIVINTDIRNGTELILMSGTK